MRCALDIVLLFPVLSFASYDTMYDVFCCPVEFHVVVYTSPDNVSGSVIIEPFFMLRIVKVVVLSPAPVSVMLALKLNIVPDVPFVLSTFVFVMMGAVASRIMLVVCEILAFPAVSV